MALLWKTVAGNVIDEIWIPSTLYACPFQPGDHLCHTIMKPLGEFVAKELKQTITASQIARWGRYLRDELGLKQFIYENDSIYYCVWCHHGIVVAPDTVIHLTRTGLSMSNVSVFAHHGMVERVHYDIGSSDRADIVVKRAMDLYRTMDRIQLPYQLIDGNCEHVARYCKTGEWISTQVAQAETKITGCINTCVYYVLSTLFQWYFRMVGMISKDPEIALIIVTILLFICILYII